MTTTSTDPEDWGKHEDEKTTWHIPDSISERPEPPDQSHEQTIRHDNRAKYALIRRHSVQAVRYVHPDEGSLGPSESAHTSGREPQLIRQPGKWTTKRRTNLTKGKFHSANVQFVEALLKLHPCCANGPDGQRLLPGDAWFPSGLLVITGRTKSRKTTWTTLLARHLWNAATIGWREVPKPFIFAEDTPEILPQLVHLLAQDFQAEKTSPKQPLQGYLDRLALKEIGGSEPQQTLKAILEEALRETPYVVFVGEVRDPDDWNQILEFARTGHRIVATTHAGSVAESFTRILGAVNCQDRPSRAEVIQSISGIINLKGISVAGAPGYETVVPSAWWGTPLSRKQLVAHGLASLVSNSASGQPSAFVPRFAYARSSEAAESMKTSIVDKLKEEGSSDAEGEMPAIFKLLLDDLIRESLTES